MALVGDGSNRILAQQVGWPDLARNFCTARFAIRSFCMILFVLWPTGRASAHLFFSLVVFVWEHRGGNLQSSHDRLLTLFILSIRQDNVRCRPLSSAVLW